jgi:hypothetical protein
MGRVEFRRALEEVIRSNASAEDHTYNLQRREIEEIGERHGLTKEEAANELLHLAGKVWVGEIHPGDGPPIEARNREDAGSVPSDWTDVVFDLYEMQERGMFPPKLY